MGTRVKFYSEKHKIIVGISARAGNRIVWRFLNPIGDIQKDVIHKNHLVHDSNYLSIGLMKNPYHRVIGSYWWASSHDPMFKGKNISFKQFLDSIETMNLDNCNFHWGWQDDHLKYDYNFKIEDGWDNIIKVIKEKRNIDLEPIKESGMSERYNPNCKVYDTPRDDLQHEGSFPSYDSYYDDDGIIKERVTKLYKPDIDMYNSII